MFIFQRLSRSCSTALFGLIFASCGLLFVLLMGVRSDYTCTWVEPAQVDCSIVESWQGTITFSETTLSSVRSAWVDESCDSDGCTYRVEIDTAQGTFPLMTTWSSGYDSKAEVAEQINTYLRAPSTRPLVGQSSLGDDMGLLILLPWSFVGIGLFIVLAGFVGFLRGNVA